MEILWISKNKKFKNLEDFLNKKVNIGISFA